VLENLNVLRDKFVEIAEGTAISSRHYGATVCYMGTTLVDEISAVEIPGEEEASLRAACLLYHDVIENGHWIRVVSPSRNGEIQDEWSRI